jgi:hypothetical protein
MSDDVCSICIAAPRRAVRTPANQVFCRECITLWLAHKPTCPNTQAPLTLAELRPVCPADDAGDVELAVVAATPPSGSSTEPPSRGEQLLWVGVVPPDPAEPERTSIAMTRSMIGLTLVAEMHVQVLVGVLSMHAYDSSGHVRRNVMSNVGDLYAAQPWRPLLAVYASSSISLIVFNLAVQQMGAVLLLRHGVHWATVLALQLAPALEANLLTAALMPARALCGATAATTALMVRGLRPLGPRSTRGHPSLFFVGCTDARGVWGARPPGAMRPGEAVQAPAVAGLVLHVLFRHLVRRRSPNERHQRGSRLRRGMDHHTQNAVSHESAHAERHVRDSRLRSSGDFCGATARAHLTTRCARLGRRRRVRGHRSGVHLVRLRNQWHPFLTTRTNRKTLE